MASSSASSSSSLHKRKYDVFLSFRGEDTRDNFTSHLYAALHRRKIETFIDYELKRGEEISPALLKAIEESKISVIIFSKDYASSKWCLEELVKILECKEMVGQIVIPVFHRVNPSDVRKQTGSFNDAFVMHEKPFNNMTDKIQRWRAALTEASSLSGWDSSVTRPESKLIDEIVKDILKKLNDIYPSRELGGLVGLDSRIEQVKSLLCIGKSDFRVVGIWGMGGIGKTTIAGAVFNQVFGQFEGCCFIANVREESEKSNGLLGLREKVLSKILEEENFNLGAPNIPLFIKDRLQRKKVFIVLDDVNNLKQLEILAAGLVAFGPGSRIIITTRDKQVLYNYGVNYIYEANGLNDHEALQLFCNYAFKQNHPVEDFMVLSNKMINHAKGNPLAIKVFGSSLYQKSKEDWKSALYKLKRISNPEIHNLLMISYNGLDHEEKNIFLDIACFFKGKGRDYVTKILDGCYLSVHFGLGVLIDKSLITITHNKLEMHDLLQEMGWEIIRQESRKMPGKRSRLWTYEDAYHVLKNKSGTKAVEGIFLDMSKIRDVLYLNPNVFTHMSNLRFLKLYFEPESSRNPVDVSKVHLPKGLRYLSNELRYLHWHRYPLETLPSNFDPENLVELNLPYSNTKELWKGRKEAFKLRFIDLCHSQYLMKFPNLLESPNLESINFGNCIGLIDVPLSIQYLDNLSVLRLNGCKNLKSFPSNIHFKSPLALDLSDCINLTTFPHILGNVKYLYLRSTGIEGIPSSIESLTMLNELDLGECKRLRSLSASMFKLNSLISLNLNGCVKLESLPKIMEKMEHLKYLYLGRTGIKELPSSIECLNGLKSLSLNYCKNIQTLPSSIYNLRSLYWLWLAGCPKLEKLPPSLKVEKVATSQPATSSDRDSKEFEDLWCFGTVRVSRLLYLKKLDLACCNLTELPEDFGHITPLLEELHISGNNFEKLPTSIKQLSQLQYLHVKDCDALQSLPELPSRLILLDAVRCKQLKSLPELPPCLEEFDASKLQILISETSRTFFEPNTEFLFTNSLKLNQKAPVNILADSQQRIQYMVAEKLRLWHQKVIGGLPVIGFCLPGSEIPNWFRDQNSGSSITIRLPRDWFNSKFIGFAICAVMAFEDYNDGGFKVDCEGLFQINYVDTVRVVCSVNICADCWSDSIVNADHILLAYHPCLDFRLRSTENPNLSGDTTATFQFYFEFREMEGCKLKRCGVCPLYAQYNMTLPGTSHNVLGATDQEFEERMVQECTETKNCQDHEANTSGSGTDRFDEEEMQPDPKRIRRNTLA